MRWGLVAVDLLAFILSACGSGNTPTRASGPAAPTPVGRLVEVGVFADRLEPPEVLLELGEPIRLRLTNRGGTQCLFFVADYVANLRAAAGGTVEATFTVPGSRVGSKIGLTTGRMGCQGDPARMGTVVVQPRSP